MAAILNLLYALQIWWYKEVGLVLDREGKTFRVVGHGRASHQKFSDCQAEHLRLLQLQNMGGYSPEPTVCLAGMVVQEVGVAVD